MELPLIAAIAPGLPPSAKAAVLAPTAIMPLRPMPLLPTENLVRTPNGLSENTTSSTPIVRKLALPARAFTPAEPVALPRATSTPTIKLGSINAPNWLVGNPRALRRSASCRSSFA